MTEAPIDCRSDLVARPSEEMIAAMTAALREPAAFGLREDPRQRALERRLADRLGTEDALLFPTCTMANEAAILAQTRPGDVLLADESSHVLTSEAGAPAALAGVLPRTLPGHDGQIDLAALQRGLAAPSDELRSPVSLIVLENTHNRSGGACLPIAYCSAVGDLAAAAGVPVHLDGARLWNAAVALGCSAGAVAEHATTVAVSLNKGLCAPLGAVLAGPAPVIIAAGRIRQRLGGGLRPTGFIAAAGLVALDTMVDGLAEDHANAAVVAAALARIDGLTVTMPEPVTNIVLVAISPHLGTVADFLQHLESRGVLALPFGIRALRLVFHRDIGRDDLPRLIEAVSATAREA